MEPFRGWSSKALAFYAGLEADNSKAYWTAHRETYEREVREPAEALLAALEPEFGAARLLRPYRDVRFSSDKTPYRTTMGAMVGDGYVALSASGLFVGAGYYHLAPDQLERYRAAVADDRNGPALEGVVAAAIGAGLDVTGTDPLRTAPRGYDVDHPRIVLLRNRGLIASRSWPVEPWLATPAAYDHVVEALRTARPLCAWLREHVNQATAAPRDPRAGRRGRPG
jgi:uncharacterized protein (TIGR02453 family)